MKYVNSIASQAAFDQALRIAFGVICSLSAVYAILRTWIWSRRAGVVRMDFMLILKLVLFACGNLANAILVVIYCVTIYFLIFYKVN